ncbi:MAG: hypothetical protein KDE64_00445, partial [Rhodocyclaceae bacterium]|nr:hypothetical protein [Rhodocyclaceae bacterium]
MVFIEAVFKVVQGTPLYRVRAGASGRQTKQIDLPGIALASEMQARHRPGMACQHRPSTHTKRQRPALLRPGQGATLPLRGGKLHRFGMTAQGDLLRRDGQIPG